MLTVSLIGTLVILLDGTKFKLHMELEFILDFLTNNSFPVNFLYKLIKKFLNGVYSDSNKAKVQSTERVAQTVKIPFFGNESFTIRIDIKDLLKEYFPQVKLTLSFFDLRERKDCHDNPPVKLKLPYYSSKHTK